MRGMTSWARDCTRWSVKFPHPDKGLGGFILWESTNLKAPPPSLPLEKRGGADSLYDKFCAKRGLTPPLCEGGGWEGVPLKLKRRHLVV